MEGAQGVLMSIAGGSDLGLFEINEAASLVQDAAHAEANIIFGTVIDDSLGDEVRVTVIAAGFEAGSASRTPVVEPRAPPEPVRSSVGGAGAVTRRHLAGVRAGRRGERPEHTNGATVRSRRRRRRNLRRRRRRAALHAPLTQTRGRPHPPRDHHSRGRCLGAAVRHLQSR